MLDAFLKAVKGILHKAGYEVVFPPRYGNPVRRLRA